MYLKDYYNETKVLVKPDKVVVKADHNLAYWNEGVDKLLTIKDHGNGYDLKFHSHSSAFPIRRFTLDYDDLEYIYEAMKAMVEEEGE